ncbi:MAG: transposase [Bacteroidota bacterium]
MESFVDAFVSPEVGVDRPLERIDQMIDWAPLAALVMPVQSGAWGRPSYPPLAMLKALLLQRWYALSDEGLEEALSDRLSFRRLSEFSLDDETPDAAASVWRRSRLRCGSDCLLHWTDNW